VQGTGGRAGEHGGASRDSPIARRPGPGQAPGVTGPQAWAVLFLPRRVPGTRGPDERSPSTGATSSPLVPWSIHDLRRTVATGSQRLVTAALQRATSAVQIEAMMLLPHSRLAWGPDGTGGRSVVVALSRFAAASSPPIRSRAPS